MTAVQAMPTNDESDKAGPSKDYRIRRGELSAYGRALNSSVSLHRLVWLVAVVIVVIALVSMYYTSNNNPLYAGFFLLTMVSLGGLFLIWIYAKRNFIEPDLAFRKWLQQVCDGDLDAQIDLDQSHAHYKELHFHTNNLATALMRLSTDMEALVDTQTQRLEYQNKSLDLLFKLTADVSRETDRRAVLDTVCRYLSDWFGTAVVSAYLIDENPIRSVAVQCVGVRAPGSHSDVMSIDSMPPLAQNFEHSTDADCFHTGWATDQLRVPFFNHGVATGMIVVDTNDYDASQKVGSERVLTTISEQLSLFLGKQSALEQSRTAQMVRDRNALAADIHDSLAQTLAALRYQVTLLQEALQKDSTPELLNDVIKIQGTIGEANQEVRGLIQEFRHPLSQRRFAEAIRTTVDAFRDSSGMQVFFQTDDPQISFTPREESQLQRIIGEALNNTAKYAQASMVRVYLRCDETGIRRLLIEDDGVGFVHNGRSNELVPTDDNSGNHIGLSIMQERASSIGATLSIETETGEGTRVSVELPPHAKFAGD